MWNVEILACVSQWQNMGILTLHLLAQDLGIYSDNLFSVRGRAGVPLDFLFAEGPGNSSHTLFFSWRCAGIPPGPLFAKLKAGQTVTLEDGRKVRDKDDIAFDLLYIHLQCSALSVTDANTFAQVDPSECVEKNTEGASVAIIDCPTLQHIPSLVSAAAKTRRPCKPSAGGKE